MIKTFENFETKEGNVGIVGIPSGEYLEVDDTQLRNLVFSNLLIYDANIKSLTFKDSDREL